MDFDFTASSGSTSCEDQTFFLTTQSGADGSFVFHDVPTGYYYMMALGPSGWGSFTQMYGSRLQSILLKPGETYDLGTLTEEK